MASIAARKQPLQRASQAKQVHLDVASALKDAQVSQQPHVNLFRHCGIGKWKKCSKFGDVTSLMDKDVKCTVYRIAGSVPAANYVQFPATPSQSLALTGRFLYLLFRPIPNRFFVMHVDLVVADEQIAVRVSLGNVYRCLKATHTWLQIPVTVPGADIQSPKERKQPAVFSASTRWNLMCVDCRELLQVYLNRRFSHVKSIRLCANMLVKNVFTSDHDYDHLAARSLGRVAPKRKPGQRLPLPRELSFYLLPGEDWTCFYDYVRLPTNTKDSTGSGGKPVDSTPSARQAQPPIRVSTDSRPQPVGVSDCGDVKVFAEHSGVQPVVMVHRSETMDEQHSDEEEDTSVRPPAALKCLEPDPILSLKKVVGFGGGTDKEVYWSKDGGCLYYPCHAVVVCVDTVTRRQTHLVGHSDKISCMAVNGPTSFLATGQRGALSVVRLWDLSSGRCSAMFKLHDHGLHSLAMSYSGSVLCGVGRDAHNKQMVVVWNTGDALGHGTVEVVARTSTDFDIGRMKIADFDDTRMVSCGRENVRFWRVRNGELRSAPVNLGSYHGVVVNDVTFEGVSGKTVDDPCQQKIFACTSNGLILQINYRQLRVDRVFQVASPNTRAKVPPLSDSKQARGILSLCVNAAFAVTGSDDGYVRLWPLDFSRVFLEAEHEAAVSAVASSADGLKVCCGTAEGQMGIVDVANRTYSTVTRSHAAGIVSASLNPQHQQLATASEDGTVCIWNLDSLEQLYTFLAPMDQPTVVAFHPRHHCIAVGYQSGYVRLFHSKSTSVITEYRCQPSPINGLVFVPSGRRLLSSSQDGSLTLFDSELQVLQPLRTLRNTVARASCVAHGRVDALSLSSDGRTVAFVGPSQHIVTVADSLTLDEVLHVDISSVSSTSDTSLDLAVRVVHSPRAIGQLLVYTAEGRLLRLAVNSGQILNEVCNLHKELCSTLTASYNGQLLFTASDRQLRVWDYHMRLDVNYQSYIGHSGIIHQLLVTPDGKRVLSLGDTIFSWECQNVHPPLPLIESASQSLGQEHPRLPPEPRSLPAPVASLQELDSTMVDGYDDEDDDEPDALVPTRHADFVVGSTAGSSCSFSGESAVGSCARDSCQSVSRSRSGSEVSHAEDCDSYSSDQSSPDNAEKIQVLPSQPGVEHRVTVPPCAPTVAKHYISRPGDLLPVTEKPFLAPASEELLSLESVMGFSGQGRGNLLWYPPSGIFIYSVGPTVVVEELSDGRQRHLTGHLSEVSSMCLRHDGKVVASVSGARGVENSQLCLWNLMDNHCTKVLTLHERDIIAVGFSPDDTMLVTLGCYLEPLLVVWETKAFTPLVTTRLPSAMHDVAWDPFRGNELVTVGDCGAVHFWMLESTVGGDDNAGSGEASYSMKVHATSMPTDACLSSSATTAAGHAQCHVTCCAYTSHSMLLIGTSTGVVSVWNTMSNTCAAHWQADSCELTFLFSSATHIVTASSEGVLRKWNVSGLEDLMSPAARSGLESLDISIEKELSVDAAVVSASFNSDLDLGLVGTAACTVWCVNWNDATTQKLLSGHTGQITGIRSWPSSEAYVATSSHDGSLRVWLASRKEQLLQLDGPEEVACTCIGTGSTPCTDTGQSRVSCSQGATRQHATIQETSTEIPPPSCHGGPPPRQNSLLYNELVSEETGQAAQLSSDRVGEAVSPPCVAGYADGSLRLFDIDRQQTQLKTAPHSSPVTCVGVSIDGGVLLSGDVSGQLLVSNAVTGMTVRRLNQHAGAPITDIDVASASIVLPGSCSAGRHGEALEGLWLAASAASRISVWSSDWRRDRCDLVDWLTFPTPKERQFAKPWSLRPGDETACATLPPTLARFFSTASGGGQIVYTGFSLQRALNVYSLRTKQITRRVLLPYWSSSMELSDNQSYCFVASREGVLRCVNLSNGSFQDIVTGCKDIAALVSIPPLPATGRLERLAMASASGVHIWRMSHK